MLRYLSIFVLISCFIVAVSPLALTAFITFEPQDTDTVLVPVPGKNHGDIIMSGNIYASYDRNNPSAGSIDSITVTDHNNPANDISTAAGVTTTSTVGTDPLGNPAWCHTWEFVFQNDPYGSNGGGNTLTLNLNGDGPLTRSFHNN